MDKLISEYRTDWKYMRYRARATEYQLRLRHAKHMLDHCKRYEPKDSAEWGRTVRRLEKCSGKVNKLI